MKLNSWNGLSLRIIALFSTAMLMSYSPDLFRGWLFEDTYIEPDRLGYRFGGGIIDEKWDWGYRHYIYFYMCLFLFLVQAARLFKWINKKENKFEP